MSIYIAFAKKKFMANMAYRFDHWMAILYSVLFVFIYWSLYRVLYGNHTEFDGITMSMVGTNFMISFVLGDAFAFDDQFLRNKISDGSIANELLRPVNFKLRILAENIGQTVFQLIYRSGPAFLFTCLWIGMKPPCSFVGFLLFIGSFILGYLVSWSLSFIIQTLSFWIINVWSISTIKTVFVDVLAGIFLPIWFLPDVIRTICSFTPFESIYYGPVRIYLGMVSMKEIGIIYVKQIVWIIILSLIGDALWRRGQKKLVVQGG